MTKQRINITLEKSTLALLDNAKRQREAVLRREISISSLIEQAILSTHKKRIDFYREQAKIHQRKLMMYLDLAKEVEK